MRLRKRRKLVCARPEASRVRGYEPRPQAPPRSRVSCVPGYAPRHDQVIGIYSMIGKLSSRKNGGTLIGMFSTSAHPRASGDPEPLTPLARMHSGFPPEPVNGPRFAPVGGTTSGQLRDACSHQLLPYRDRPITQRITFTRCGCVKNFACA